MSSATVNKTKTHNKDVLKKKGFITNVRKNKMLYLFALPGILYCLIFIILPLILGFRMSFQEFTLLGPKDGYVGLDNYKKLLDDPFFIQTIKNTLFLAAGITAFGVILPIIIAIGINEIIFSRFKRFIQTFVYIPKLFSWVIIVGLLINLFSITGTVNTFLMNVGIIKDPIDIFTDGGKMRWAIIYMTTWKDLGYNTLIYLAAITTVDLSLYEAVDVDGGKFRDKVRYVTLPEIIPTIKLVLIMTLTGSLRTFDQSLLLLNGATYEDITTSVVYTYQKGMLQGDIGVAMAGAMLVFLFTFLFITVLRKIIKY